ncbi:TraM recognition domain-containing protein [Nonomuraea phyllanthi]|uniref:TraM recognition domain-containing protein n=1 Tax=Nonomuraea phyllanthi TaxID=2219224 RepID=UPI001D13F817|nr:TraM recognition domain-containing protein [Nonomuraea phyllanthi]
MDSPGSARHPPSCSSPTATNPSRLGFLLSSTAKEDPVSPLRRRYDDAVAVPNDRESRRSLVHDAPEKASLGSRPPYGGLDPPPPFVLDEVADTGPVPLPAWPATAAGSGMSMIVAGQSWSRFRHRWRERGANTIWNSAKAEVSFGAVSDPDDLEVISKLCGEVTLPVWEESRDARGERLRTRRWETVRVLPAEQARMLPGPGSPERAVAPVRRIPSPGRGPTR